MAVVMLKVGRIPLGVTAATRRREPTVAATAATVNNSRKIRHGRRSGIMTKDSRCAHARERIRLRVVWSQCYALC